MLASGVQKTSLPFLLLPLLVHSDKHVKLLHRMKQPVPQSVALLVADARRKEDKKTAKQIANAIEELDPALPGMDTLHAEIA